ncbi:aspartate carbamoyltransferase [Sulfurisphaera tokodaii]|uniref:Aspartate carbamoyltransferase catalytic subunit n=2 Tax=Sulfurisphaera tokodaii TaxID=111955 RepID=PYRB_SULTO|nr:aspartate carbamoyltransferase [Sulfurisphaera tokodaii]Q970X2.1 RecName: Full=Aspartate carbamoyltransferase catalytic subunit; AltName: Full=Aspartate transcarbamylase; Short=ATCase [Sulfurisphaera tokodaii str. 7]BAB66551.1 aspartate carbamoyltransferase [Sulfurisphaera tokodaii str. 7]HII73632.1 aspartate carbamoyltransferase [Sulfurisphaera tokodaii]
MKDIISVYDFSKSDFDELFELADKLRNMSTYPKILKEKTVALAFFEPSTRTYLSFNKAAINLGASTIGFSGEEGTSIAKGENLADTIRMLNNYADMIVIRHKFDGAAKFASEISEIPVINAGDGKHEHPTQTVIDFYTIYRNFKNIDGLTFGLMGDLRYARVVNSFLRALTRFKPKKVYLISPPQLSARKEILEELNYPYREVIDYNEVIEEIDVLYVTRIQKERFPDESEYEKVKESYVVDMNLVSKMKKDAIILHALPRVNEISREVDKTPQAKYFEQASYAVPVRMAIFHKIVGE